MLTKREYWESGYAAQSDLVPLQIEGFRNLGSRRLIEKIESLGVSDLRVLEVGAGNSSVLTHLARKYEGKAEFCGLDYSESGCALLARRAKLEGARVRVLRQDVLEPTPDLLGQFDLVYSVGVVEHFSSLCTVLLAIRRFLSGNGRMLTVIPNMAGILGTLTRRYNQAIYELHVPHDLESFLRGHGEAGLEVIGSGYLGSTNFGILSSCFSRPSDRGWTTYLWLSRLTKLLWFFEAGLGELPHSAALSPYLFAVSRAGQ